MNTCLLSIFLTVVPMQGSFLAPLQEGRDTVLIADQMMYGVELKDVVEGTRLFFPDIERKEPGEGGVMVLSDWRIDTLDVKKQKKGLPRLYDIRAGFTVTSFIEGEYALPPIMVERHSPDGAADTLSFDPLTMNVAPVQIDTVTFQLHDIKGQIRYPLTFAELLPYILGFQLLAVIVILAVCLILMFRRKRIYEETHRDPAHIVALRKLDTFRGDRLWLPEKQKVFYSGVTDALREYIVARYGISAMEMTTKEIFDGLKGTDVPEELYSELKSLFERADYVKFAKYVATNEENASAVPLAVRFVTTTYQAEVNADETAVAVSEASRTGAYVDGASRQTPASSPGSVDGEAYSGGRSLPGTVGASDRTDGPSAGNGTGREADTVTPDKKEN